MENTEIIMILRRAIVLPENQMRMVRFIESWSNCTLKEISSNPSFPGKIQINYMTPEADGYLHGLIDGFAEALTDVCR